VFRHVDNVLESTVRAAADALSIPVIKLEMTTLPRLSAAYGISVRQYLIISRSAHMDNELNQCKFCIYAQAGPCLDLFAPSSGQTFARQQERCPDLPRVDVSALTRWVQWSATVHGISLRGVSSELGSSDGLRSEDVYVGQNAAGGAGQTVGPKAVSSTNMMHQAAWQLFQEMDEDGNGLLDRTEMGALSSKLNMKLGKKLLESAFRSMDPSATGEVEFSSFLAWYSNHKEENRRKVRSTVQSAFERRLASDASRYLSKEEFQKFVADVKSELQLLPPAFDLETDWALMKITEKGVSFEEFESWWKQRIGVDTPDVDVLPEYIEGRRSEFVPMAVNPSARDRWKFAHANIVNADQIEKQWGEGSRYQAFSRSQMEKVELPPCIRDPESTFSAVWDGCSLLFLLYVMLLIPLRTCFELSVKLWTFNFFVVSAVCLYLWRGPTHVLPFSGQRRGHIFYHRLDYEFPSSIP
jgi:Ca2+-binding EF-hand superfamily protein